MTDEITPKEEVIIEAPIEPVSEPVEATIPSEPEIPTTEPEPTAQIPVNEPFPTPSEIEAEPIIQTISTDTKPVETGTQPELVSETIPESVPQTISEPVAEVKPEISEPIAEPIQTESKPVDVSPASSAPSASQPTAIPETKPEPKPEPVSESKPESITEVIPAIIIPKSKTLARELLVKARNMIQFRKRKKLDKIMTLFAKQTKITNDEVEKLLHVSDATAGRYLNTLEQENKIKQNGKTGKSVFYSKI